MAERKVYLYRLIVTLPPEAADPDWVPQAWLDEPVAPVSYAEGDEAPFRWPSNQLYLSATSAKRRADLFRKYGATVTVERSVPVVWAADGLATLYEARDDFRKIITHAEAEWARGEYEKRQAAADTA